MRFNLTSIRPYLMLQVFANTAIFYIIVKSLFLLKTYNYRNVLITLHFSHISSFKHICYHNKSKRRSFSMHLLVMHSLTDDLFSHISRKPLSTQNVQISKCFNLTSWCLISCCKYLLTQQISKSNLLYESACPSFTH